MPARKPGPGESLAPAPKLRKPVYEKSLEAVSPAYAKLWDTERNGGLTPRDVAAGSKYEYYWIGECGHHWYLSIAQQVNRRHPCAYCIGKDVLVGFNDLGTTHPELASEWHPELNGELSFTDVTYGSREYVWWLGNGCGHVWQMAVKNRSLQSQGCPYHANARGGRKKVLAGFNDLATEFPNLAAEWHPVKNGAKTPQSVTGASHSKVWWLGKDCGHEWDAIVKSRTKSGQCCPYCSGNRVLVGFNDLASRDPELAAEWHPTANIDVTPQDVTFGSNFKAFWLCKEGHSWKTPISSRRKTQSRIGTKCPACEAKTYISRAEQELYDAIRDMLPGALVERTRRDIIRGELDIVIPEFSVAVEFNGIYWHTEDKKGKEYHLRKTQAAQKAGFKLIHVWEDDWYERRDLVLRSIHSQISPSISEPDEKICQIDNNSALGFLNDNHLLGAIEGEFYFGAFNGRTPEAVLVVKHGDGRGEWKIQRYANIGNRTSLFSLLEYAEDFIRLQGLHISKWIASLDIATETGVEFEAQGFRPSHATEPDYMYTLRSKRLPREAYDLDRFRYDENLKYQAGLSLEELEVLNNMYRIWDCGQLVWVKEITSEDNPI